MTIRCIKQVVDQEDSETVYFEEGVQYEASVEGTSLCAIDETGDSHVIAENKDGIWENDDWFYDHFKIT